MAVVLIKRKVTNNDAFFKITGSDGNVTINITTDLLSANEVISGTPAVSLAGVIWTGDVDSILTITRNNKVIYTLQAGAAGFLDFSNQMFPPDNTESTSDITISINASQGEMYLKLRKTSGYRATDLLSLLNG